MNTAEALSALSLEEFDRLLARGVFREGTKVELLDGVIHAQANETQRHGLHEARAAIALNDAIRAAGLPCVAAAEFSSVASETLNRRVFPDVSVVCQPTASDLDRLDSDPVIVVEIVSPSSVELDFETKATAYRDHPSIAHYLVIDPDTDRVIHHDHARQRTDEHAFDGEARLLLEPPGLELPVRALRVPEAS